MSMRLDKIIWYSSWMGWYQWFDGGRNNDAKTIGTANFGLIGIMGGFI